MNAGGSSDTLSWLKNKPEVKINSIGNISYDEGTKKLSLLKIVITVFWLMDIIAKFCGSLKFCELHILDWNKSSNSLFKSYYGEFNFWTISVCLKYIEFFNEAGAGYIILPVGSPNFLGKIY